VWVDSTVYVSSPHPYPNDYRNYWYIYAPGNAVSIKVHFYVIETEDYFDSVNVYDGGWHLVASYTGNHNNVWTPEIDGNEAIVELVSDSSDTAYGFDIDLIKYLKIPSPPLFLDEGDIIIFGKPQDTLAHTVVVVQTYPLLVAAHSNDHDNYDWKNYLTPYGGQFKYAYFFEIPFSAGGYHNLAYYWPWDWPAPLVISAEPGNHEQDYNNIEPGQTYYIDWAMQSNGYPDIPDTVKFTLYLDNMPVHSWYVPGLWTGDQKIVEDYPLVFSSSSQRLTIKADPEDYWEESDEWDNEFYLDLTGICEDTTPPTCTLTSPNGGESVDACDFMLVQWGAEDPPEPPDYGITGQAL